MGAEMSVKPDPLSPSRIFEVNLPEFDENVLNASVQQPVLVDFWADWCPPCISLAPVLEKVVMQYPEPLSLAKLEVDVDENMKLAGRYAVRGFPTVIFFQDGQEKGRFSSMQSSSFIENFIDQCLSQA